MVQYGEGNKGARGPVFIGEEGGDCARSSLPASMARRPLMASVSARFCGV